jgi:hypothetical protein
LPPGDFAVKRSARACLDHPQLTPGRSVRRGPRPMLTPTGA